ncbi:Aldehyde/histidinol dehydrogenase [Penicillium occitanis (nom. inval.)]|nr:hypothetical protein PENOC_037260 [Penicillium occitanis (nom. inval.)]PCH06879.1 Aldehyde/histidinol dehydrogenase [Penicillium occitanis (nom. inval.)]
MAESQTPAGEPARVPLIINGQDIYTPEQFDVISPKTGKHLWSCSSVTRYLANDAAVSASRAFPAWSATKPAVRRGIFMRVADLLEQRAAEFQAVMADEMGAVEPFVTLNTNLATEMIRDVAGRIAGALSGQTPICEGETYAIVQREPYGVVLGIAPWNAPFILGFRAVIYALGAGSTCILKGSEVSPRCFWLIGSIFRDAGLPDGCLNVIYHRPEDAAEITTALIEHPAIRKINFTGSTAVGRIISATAGKNLKPVLMELGGKASAIICEDADLRLAAKQCAVGAFLNAGQICMSTERIIVRQSVLSQFTELLKAAISDVHGPEGTSHTVAQAGTVVRNRQLVKEAVSRGATIIYGGHDERNDNIQPLKLPVTVVQGVSPGMDLFQTESFGPTVSLIASESDEHAIAIANDTEYGLTAAVFTRDIAKGLLISRQIRAGAVHINSMTVHDEAVLPHGGVKESGWGRFNADAGLAEFLQTKTVTINTAQLN